MESEEEEEVVPIGTLFADQQIKIANTKKKILEKVQEYRRTSENPIRAELFNVIKQYVQMDVRRIGKFLPELTSEYFDALLRPNKHVTAAENRNAQLIRLVKYLVEKKSKEFIVGLISMLQLRVICRNKEKVTWRAMELGRPSAEEEEEESSDEETNLSEFGRNWKKNMNELYQYHEHDDDDPEMTAVQSIQKPPFVFLAFTTLNATRKKRKIYNSTAGRIVEDVSTVVVAFNPQYRFLFIRPVNKTVLLQATILNFITTMERKFRGYKALNLQDVGLTRVFQSCTRSAIQVDETSIQQSLSNDVDDASDDDMIHLSSFNDSTAKRRKLMANLINDKTEGGFQTLTFQFLAPKYNNVENVGLPSAVGDNVKEYPISFKFTSKQHQMDSMFAEMIQGGYLEDGDMYLQARNNKTNVVTKEFQDMD